MFADLMLIIGPLISLDKAIPLIHNYFIAKYDILQNVSIC